MDEGKSVLNFYIWLLKNKNILLNLKNKIKKKKVKLITAGNK
jgi:hypothetical protein